MIIIKYEYLSTGIVQKMLKRMHCQQSGYVLRWSFQKHLILCWGLITYYNFLLWLQENPPFWWYALISSWFYSCPICQLHLLYLTVASILDYSKIRKLGLLKNAEIRGEICFGGFGFTIFGFVLALEVILMRTYLIGFFIKSSEKLQQSL
jgi:hypothetical protein